MAQMLMNATGFILTWSLWLWLANRRMAPAENLGLALGSTAALIPIIFSGRWFLDRQSNPRRAEWIAIALRYIKTAIIGTALMSAVRLGLAAPDWPLAMPVWLGLSLVLVVGLSLLLAILSIIFDAMEPPFVLALTRVVLTEWMNTCSCNPMIVASLAFLLALGLWMSGGLFLVWLMVVLSPALLVFISVYEEHELEIRFGQGSI